ncbi:hypothetical protein GJAV_G00009090 [Gymnothorax javanicus]|nr:hypothetical protein GJAV_G00009090 [Gymnothorax javanicus]
MRSDQEEPKRQGDDLRMTSNHHKTSFSLMVHTMLPRSMRTTLMDLPGVGPREVPLIGYRPLKPDSDNTSGETGKLTDNKQLDALQVEASPMKTTWYCPLDMSSVTEKQEDGVIYTVIVKQQNVSPTCPAPVTLRSQCVKAGTEEKLVLHLLHSFSMGDSSYVSIFLSTYRSFTSTQRVLDILTDRLEHPPGESKCSQSRLAFNMAVCSVFSAWLAEYPEDFRSLSDPGPILRLVPLLPTDSSGSEVKGRLLQIAEELSEKTLLCDSPTDSITAAFTPTDPAKFDATNILGFLVR